MNHLDLFSGIGGFALAAKQAGLEFAQSFHSDINEFTNKIYQKNFPASVALGDVRKINPRDLPKGQWLITAGFPCQPFSIAGKGLGSRDKRNLWGEVVRLVSALNPDWVVCENVPNIENIPFQTRRFEVGSVEYQKGIDSISTFTLFQCVQDLEKEGYSVAVFEVPALAKNAPHRRQRVWIVANRESVGDGRRNMGSKTQKCDRSVADFDRQRKFQPQREFGNVGKRIGDSFTDVANTSSERLQIAGQSDIGELSEEEKEGLDDRLKQSNSDSANIGRFGNQQERLTLAESEVSEWHDEKKWHKWLEVATKLCRVDDGLSSKLDITRLRADLQRLYPTASEKHIARAIKLTISQYRRSRIESLGNSIVSAVAKEIFRVIKFIEDERKRKN
jgi:DNA-cytosine methyltransferase